MAHLILLALLLVPTAALADPITLVATLAPIFGSTVAGFIVSYGGYIAFGALQLAGAASARRKQRAAAAKQRAQYLASLQDRSVTVLSTEAPWQIVYGSPAPIGGALQAILSSGSVDQYQHLVIVFNRRPSYSIDEVYIEGEPVGALDGSGWCTGGKFFESSPDITITEEVAFDGAGVGTTAHPINSLLSVTAGEMSEGIVTFVATASGSTVTLSVAGGFSARVSYTYSASMARVNIQKHLSPGGVDTADAFLMAACPDQWTAAHKASDTTYLVVTLDLRFGGFQGGPPNITAKGRWSLLYDYRTSTTGYSANPALCAADFLTSEAGFGADTSQVDSAAAIAAANACDAQGFTCDGLVSTGSSRDANLQQIEDAMAGATHFSGGVWRIMAGAWSTPVLTLTDAYLAGPIEVVQAANGSAERFNTVRGQYAPASGLGTVPDYTPYVVAAYVTADGKEKVHDLPMPMVGTNAQAQKLAAIAVERSRAGETINYPAHLSAWKLQPGDRVYVTNPELGYVAKTFRMVDWTFSATAPVGLVLTEDTASMYTGTFTDPDAPDVTSSLGDPFAKPSAPADLAADSGDAVLVIGADGTIITRVSVTWQATTVRSILQGGYTQLQWRSATATDDRWQNVDLPADADSQMLTDVVDGDVLLIRVRHVNGLQVIGTWATVAHAVLGKNALPPDVTAFSIDGTRITWSPVAALDLAGYEIRFQYDNNTWWESAATLHEGILTDSPYVMTSALVGSFTLLIKAVDTSGNYSANAASVLVNLGSSVVSNILQSWPQAPLFTEGTIVGGAVSTGVLEATATDLFYGPDLEPFYGADTDTFYLAGTYTDMSYTWSVAPPSAGTLLLDQAIVASAFTVEYQRDNTAAFYGPDGDYFYGADADPFYDAPGPWTRWPGMLSLSAAESINLRISTAGGATQGQISTATPKLDVPDVRETLTNVVIAAGGTRLALTKTYRAIKSVQVTAVADGNGGVTARAEDSLITGPLVKVFDGSGVAVIGLVYADIVGY